MDLTANADLNRINAHLLDTMQGFMHSIEKKGGEAPYTAADIERCAAILDAFIAKLHSAAGNAERIMLTVRDTVLNLNNLSKEVESLIETAQREDLCEFIELAAKVGGLDIDAGQDITEQWREW